VDEERDKNMSPCECGKRVVSNEVDLYRRSYWEGMRTKDSK